MPKFYIPKYVTTTILEDVIILMDLRKNTYYALKDSAVEFWQALEKYDSFDLAINEVSKSYNASKDVIKKDMENFVFSLLKAGLLDRRPSGI
ncbi:PqqD family protein [Tychonema sp. LEGE 07199]|uniref:PqqD family protein n=1 Tax=unclassified Tychonema TaxID=2642144 RepID=UPI001880F266|nr:MULTISPECIES: PqqD family protein [unclassified Tychonema]MBE9120193.1 PqqD family protein [Tychonema sp. LEGE 07199]MBE9133039.1 PqqD family protein [Tychonema sp. LEGE 07196]